jgi:hypothetical protein
MVEFLFATLRLKKADVLTRLRTDATLPAAVRVSCSR